MMRLAMRIACLMVFATILASSSQAARRVALVIGNAAYQHTEPLANPSNDAADLAATLGKLGFEVVVGKDLDKRSMERSIREFGVRIEGAEVALFFYAGHGIQISGQNYLMPIDARLAGERDVDFETIPLHLILKQMQLEAKAAIILLDACRNNPLATNLARNMGVRAPSIGQGLAEMRAGIGTLIGFSTEPGSVALDGKGRNSPYAEALLKHMPAAGRDASAVLIEVRNEVLKATNGKQVPWEHTSLTGQVFFSTSAPPPQPQATLPAALGRPGVDYDKEIELSFWNAVKDQKSPALLQTYLDRYPGGYFATVARVMIEQIGKEQAAAAQAVAREAEARQAEAARAKAQTKQADEQRKADQARLSDELAKARSEAERAREDMRAADAERQAALKAAEDARKAEAAARAEQSKLAKAAADAAVAAKKAELPAGRSGAAAAALSLVAPPATREKTDAPVHACDRLAGDPGDSRRKAAGPEDLEKIDLKAAEKACQSAFEKFPDVVRFQYQLGRVHDAAKNYAAALRFYQMAANAGYAEGIASLGTLYDNGEGVEKDAAKAVELYRDAIRKGSTDALTLLAANYDDGIGVDADPVEAARLVLLALDKGNTYALKQLAGESHKWTLEFRKAIQERLREAKHYTGAIDGDFGSMTKQAIKDYAAARKK